MVFITENRSWFYRTFNTGGINRNDPDNPVDNREHVGMAFFRDKVATVVNNNYMKAIILLIFAAYLCGAGYGITQIKEGLERKKLSKEDSYSVRFFDLEDEFYREYPYRMQVVVAGEYNYSDVVSAFFGFSYIILFLFKLILEFVFPSMHFRRFKINTKN